MQRQEKGPKIDSLLPLFGLSRLQGWSSPITVGIFDKQFFPILKIGKIYEIVILRDEIEENRVKIE